VTVFRGVGGEEKGRGEEEAAAAKNPRHEIKPSLNLRCKNWIYRWPES